MYLKSIFVRNLIMLPIHTILHPTDYSEHSQNAFQLACALARDYGARLIVLHAMPVGTTELLVLSQLGTQEKTESIKESLWNELRKIQPPDASIAVEHRLEDGDPDKEICRVVQESHADLIVMGTHGRTGLSRLLMGSVAEQVMRQAECPVLTVRLPMPETIAERSAVVPATAAV